MNNKLNLDPNKASKPEQKEVKEEDVAVVLVELLQNCGILLGQIAESQAILADCAQKTLELDLELVEEDDDFTPPIEPEVS
jgi:hypothetical protein